MSPKAFTVRVLKDLLAKESRIKEAYLFGSVAKGDEKLASDIDMALLVEEGYDANTIVFEVYEKFGTKVVPITFHDKHELHAFMVDKTGERLK
jgi:predicted nucleotidyltransferase